MSHWPIKTLGELCDVRIGRTPRRDQLRFWGDGAVWVTVGELNGGIITRSKEQISDIAIRECMPEPVPTGTLLFSFKLSIGKMAVAGCPLYTNEAIAALLIRNSAKLSRDFLRFALLRESHEGTANTAVMGKVLNKEKVQQLSIPVPPLAEQERIVKILDEADELRKLRAQADCRTADLIPALFHEMFGDLTTNPKQWPLKMLGDITRIDAPMVDPRLEEYLDLPHVGPERIEGGTGKILPTKTAREDDLISGKFLFDGRHVLYSKIRPYLRKVALPAFRGLCSADVYPVIPVQSEICREYLWAVLLSECFTKYTAGHRERANIPKVNREQFSAYQCPLPPISLQNEFAQRVAEIREMEADQAASRTRLDALFQSLLHRAFEGEL